MDANSQLFIERFTVLAEVGIVWGAVIILWLTARRNI